MCVLLSGSTSVAGANTFTQLEEDPAHLYDSWDAGQCGELVGRGLAGSRGH